MRESLSPAELVLWEAFPAGAEADLGGTGEPVIRAVVAAALLLGAREAQTGHRPALRLRGARITGRLDLDGATLEHTVRWTDCVFDSEPRIADATTQTMAFIRCTLPGFDGARIRVTGCLSFAGSTLTGPADLCGARVEGKLSLRGVEIVSAPGAVALAADGLHVEGDADCGAGFVTPGMVRLRGARVGGSFNLGGARIGSPGHTSLNLDRAAIGGRLAARGLMTHGQLKLRNATVDGSVQLSGASLSAPGGTALGAGGLTARGGLWLRDGFSAEGEVRLVGAELRANLALDGATLANPGRSALSLNRAVIGEVDATGLTVASGKVSLAGARVGSRIVLDDVSLINPGATALDLSMAQAGELSLRPGVPVQGAVLLDHARLGLLRDDPERWPQPLHLEGLTYEVLDPALTARERLAWLAREPDDLRSQPYEQLAGLYTLAGRQTEARRVLHAKERRQSKTKSRADQVWCTLQDVTVGYGYQPWRAVIWLVVLLAIGTALYATARPAPLKRDEAPHFNPLVYTFDLLLPIVDLGQERAFNPAGAAQWFSYLLVAAGWLLAGTAAAGAARVIGRR